MLLTKNWVFNPLHRSENAHVERWVSVLSFVLIGFAVFKQYRFYFNPDLAWHLVLAELCAKGKMIYQDIFEINPPLVFDFTNLFYKIVHFFNGDPLFWLNAFNLAVTGWCFGWTCRLLKDVPYVPLAAAFIFFLHPMDNGIGSRIGQKEHLFLMATFPYLLVLYAGGASAVFSGRNRRDSWSRWLIPGIAALGFMVKPFFLMIWMAGFIWVLLHVAAERMAHRDWSRFSIQNGLKIWRETWRRTDAGLILVLQLGFVGWVFFAHPAYLFKVVPLGMETYLYYGFFGWKHVILSILYSVFLYGMGLVVIPPLWGRLPKRTLYFAYLTLVAMVMVAIQRKGWAYQKQPVELYVLWASFFFWPVAWRFLQEARSKGGWFYLEPESIGGLLFVGYQIFFLAQCFFFLLHLNERDAMNRYVQIQDLEMALQSGGPHRRAFAWFHGTPPSFPAVNDLHLDWVGEVNTFLLWDGMDSFHHYYPEFSIADIKKRFPKSQDFMQQSLVNAFRSRPDWLWVALGEKALVKDCADLSEGLKSPAIHYHPWIEWTPEVAQYAREYRCVKILKKSAEEKFHIALFQR